MASPGEGTCPRCGELLPTAAQVAPPRRSSGQLPAIAADVASGAPVSAAGLSLEDTRSGSGAQSTSGSAGLSAAPGGQPRRFGRFEPIEKLGAGAFGAVWRARDPEREEEVALKVLTNLSDQASARFEVEVEANRKLTHPNVVPVLEHGKIKGRPYLVMPFVSGSALTQRPVPCEGGLSLQEAVAVVRDVALAVHEAHGVGVLHRDIKPDNVLVDAAGKPWILDFGMAQAGPSRALTNTGDMVGTPEYMAPEQARGEGHRVDERCDVYALGATLYFLLTARAPLIETSIHAQLAKVLFEVPDPPSSHEPGIPAELDAISLKCLEKDPARRYSSALELAQDLERWLMGEVTVAESQVLTALTPAAPDVGAETKGDATLPLALGLVLLTAGVAVVLLLGGERAASRGADHASALVPPDPTPSLRPSASSAPSEARPALAAIAARVGELRGEAAELRGSDPERALKLLDRALGLAPNDAQARRTRGSLRLSRGDFRGAAADLGLACDLLPGDAPARLLRGRALLGAGETVEARGALEVVDAAELEPPARRALELAWSELELQERAPKRALQRLTRLIQEGRGPRAYLLLGRAHEALDQHDAAREAYTEAASLGEPQARRALERLLSAPARSTPAPAPRDAPVHVPLRDSELLTLVRLGPPPLPVHREAFRARWGRASALVEGQERTRRGGAEPAAWTELGHALAVRSRYQEALEAYRRALKRSPGHAAALCGRGALRLLQGEPSAALRDLSRALQGSPTGEAYRLFGLAHLRAGTPEEARAELERACRSLREGALWQVLGRIHEAAQRWEEAKASYQAAVVGRAEAEVLLDRGRAWLQAGRPDRALADFQSVLETDAGSLAALRWRSLVRLRQGNLEAALDDVELALGADPSQTRSLFLRGALRLLAGDSAGAVEDLGAARAAGSSLPCQALEGVALARAGQAGPARELLGAFLKAAPEHPLAPRLRSLVEQLGQGE